jgi:hypothetical protein
MPSVTFFHSKGTALLQRLLHAPDPIPPDYADFTRTRAPACPLALVPTSVCGIPAGTPTVQLGFVRLAIRIVLPGCIVFCFSFFHLNPAFPIALSRLISIVPSSPQ